MPIPKTTTRAEQEEELRRIGIDGDDGGDAEIDSKRQPSQRLNARPRTVTEIDTAAIYAKFNAPKPGKTLGADED